MAFPKIIIKSHNQDRPYTMIGGDLVSTSKGWHLFDYTGLPYRHSKNLLAVDEYLMYLCVASEVVIAISNQLNIFI